MGKANDKTSAQQSIVYCLGSRLQKKKNEHNIFLIIVFNFFI